MVMVMVARMMNPVMTLTMTVAVNTTVRLKTDCCIAFTVITQ